MDGDEVSAVAWQDVLFAALIGVTFLFLAAVASIKAKQEQAAGTKAPGNLIVTITWPQGDDDVDLWLDGPKEKRPVGYSHKAGVEWNLLRDDLGDQSDLTKLNYENAYSRGLSAGEYVVNVHAFRCPDLPIKVNVTVDMNKTAGAPTIHIFATTVTLIYEHEELTALRFRLDAKGDVVPGSVNHLFKPLRTGE